MGDSNLPLYAYVDESGNTGHNLFDEVQPDFFTAALVTKGDFDLVYSDRVRDLALRFGQNSLHATELGFDNIEKISAELLEILVAARSHIFVARVEKKYLLATKIFDSLFDSGENAAVAWHHYNVRPLRLMLVFKLAAIVDESTARMFWDCILETDRKAAYAKLPNVCSALLQHIEGVVDERARQVLREGLEWAISNPESIQIHVDRKIARRGHFPNMVAFANLLDGLEEHSNRLKRPVARITHDQQSEFETTLEVWHNMFSTAPDDEIRWAGETYAFQKVVGSQFEVRPDSDSPGIQVVDVILWLYSRLRKGNELPAGCSMVMAYAFQNGWENDFSFDGVGRLASETFGPALLAPLSDEQMNASRKLMQDLEDARLNSMARYEEDEIPPFMRQNQSSQTED